MKVMTIFLAAMLLPFSVYATSIAIIDSGTDLKHLDLVKKAWVNPGETDGNKTDDDGNGYVDDINGWNFAENNNQVIDYKYLGTFSHDVYRFFDVQYRLIIGTATEADKKWYKEKINDENFVKELSKFANFVHGTHVAGISARDADAAKVMAVKLIPTEAGLGFFSDARDIIGAQPLADEIDPFMDFLIRMGIDKLADQQMGMLKTIGEYVNKAKMRVANCSFGTSMVQAKMIMAALLPMVINRDPTEEEIELYAKYFMEKIIEKGKGFVDAAKNTFFVMAAGNDGTDNDELPTSPANVKKQNTITVAATYEYKKLASFSNFGMKMVEVAAPGVGIKSAIPGDEYLMVSGTSQAAPFVANVASRVLDINPKLNFDELKMIIMKTVDRKEYLIDKVRSGGIVNPKRALEAASLSLSMNVSNAIEQARQAVPDVVTTLQMPSRFEGFVIPLAPMFVLE